MDIPYPSPPKEGEIESDILEPHMSGKKYETLEQVLYKGQGSRFGEGNFSPDPMLVLEKPIDP